MQRRGRKHRKVEPPDDPFRLSPRAWLVLAPLSVVLAVPGIVIYARDPDVGTYQLNGLLTVPLILVVLYWLHRWLPLRLQWILALAFAPVGSVAYLLVPNAQWFNYGPLTVFPLTLLLIERADPRSDRYPAAWFDGPWGPP